MLVANSGAEAQTVRTVRTQKTKVHNASTWHVWLYVYNSTLWIVHGMRR